MTALADQLLNELLKLEPVEEHLFRGCQVWKTNGNLSVYGGQVVGQALQAAYATVDEPQFCHSLHAYFLKRGNPNLPIDYSVKTIREGRSLVTRSVEAMQDPEQPIFTMLCSFALEEPDTVVVNASMPADVKQPEECLDIKVFLQKLIDSDELPEDKHKTATNTLLFVSHFPVELRPLDPEVFYKLKRSDEAVVRMWVRLREPSSNVHTNRLMHAALAYMSDYGTFRAAAVTRPDIELGMVTSLDHAVWFHKPIHAQDWLLYEAKCNFAGSGRCINRGMMWRQNGDLVATIMQEGLIRAKI